MPLFERAPDRPVEPPVHLGMGTWWYREGGKQGMRTELVEWLRMDAVEQQPKVPSPANQPAE